MCNPRSQIPIILGHPFLATANAIINCRNRFVRLTFGDMTREVNVFNLEKQPRDVEDQTFEVNLIENMTSEHREELELETESEFKLESMDFELDQIVKSIVSWASSPISPNLEPTNLTPPSTVSFPSIELKSLPKHLKCVYLGGQETLPVIIGSHLTDGEEKNLTMFLEKIEKPLVGL